MTRAALALLCCGCMTLVQDMQFKTRAPDTIWDRAVSSVETNCGGVRQADPERYFILSKWQAWHAREGMVLARCMVSIVPEGRQADVRVAFTVRLCPVSQADDLEAVADTCPIAESLPDEVSAEFDKVGKRLDFDLRR